MAQARVQAEAQARAEAEAQAQAAVRIKAQLDAQKAEAEKNAAETAATAVTPPNISLDPVTLPIRDLFAGAGSRCSKG